MSVYGLDEKSPLGDIVRHRFLKQLFENSNELLPLVQSGLWSVALRLVGALAAFAIGILLARQLGPTGLGLYGVVAAISSILSTLAQLGLPPLATREVAVSKSMGDRGGVVVTSRWFIIAVAFAGLISAGALGAVSAIVKGPSLLTWLWGAALVVPTALIFLVGALLRGLDRILIGQSLENVVRPLFFAVLLIAALGGSVR